ncbi:MAG: 3'-5' exonuclease, partial [Pseudomonadota bacterium]
ESRPGRVELWPLVRKSETDNTGVWYEPVDRVAPEDPSSVLAQAIATRIAAMIADPYETIGEGKSARRLNAGDFLVLVRGRTGQGDIFQTIIRGLKSEGLRVAGADVMRLDSEMAVKDLKALLEFLALPEDSLALATVLRSPLLGWSEGDLYSLAAPREETYLWRALENRADEFPETVALLRDLRDASDYQRPYELIERILVRHGGRRRLIARLGAECEEAIDAFLGQVLTFERDQIPSLTGFLAWLDGQSAVVKRALDQSGGGVRVMTVHGAKGLEAPVVILPDTMRGEQRERSACLIDSDGLAHWLGARAERPNTLSAAAEMQETKTARERQRLLYVAMTRAESRLIVCGAGEESALDGTWYAAVQEGLRRAGAAPLETPLGAGLVLRSGTFDPVDSPVEKTGKAPDPILPAWANEAAPDPLQGAVRSPSDLGGAKALPGEGRSKDEALRRGAQIHLLLEHLSHVNAPERDALAVTLLGHGDLALTAPDAAQLTAEVSSLLDAPSLKYVFAPDTLAEVSVTAALPELGGTRIHGVIDRLVITDSSVLIVDYKTNEVVPSDPREVPEGILRQMGAYRAAIQQVYPDRAVDTAVLWTTTGTLMDLPNEIVMNALERTTTS